MKDGAILINYGDEVVYCMPSYEAFPDMVSDNGGVRVEVPLDADYRFDLDAMLMAITPKTKIYGLAGLLWLACHTFITPTTAGYLKTQI